MAFNKDSLLKIYNSNKYSNEKRFKAIQQVTYYYDNNNVDSFSKYLYKSAKFCKINGMDAEYHKTIANFGYSLKSFGRYQEARKLLSIAKEYYLKQNDVARASYCETQLANIYCEMDMIIEAYKGYKKAQSYFDSTFINKIYYSGKSFYKSQNDSNQTTINLYLNIMTDYGIFLKRLSDYDNALVVFNKIEHLAEISANSNRLSGTYINQALVFMDDANYQTAIIKLKKAINITQKTSNISYRVIATNTLANIYLIQNRLLDCKQLTDETVKISKNGMFPYELCTSLLLNAEVYLKLKQYDIVYKNATEALSIARNMKLTPHQLDLYFVISKYFINVGNKDSAEYYLDLRDSLVEANKKANNNYKIDLLRLTTDLEKKQEAEKAAIGKAKLFNVSLWFLSALLLLTIAAIILLAFVLKMRNKRNHTLKDMNMMKNRFFSIVAHDIMSPVALNKQTWDLFQSLYKKLDQNELDELISGNVQSSARLYELTNDLLLWARTMMKEININYLDINIDKLFDKPLELIKGNFKDKNINFRNELDRSLLVKCDKDLISFVIRNLLANAVKFTNNGGEVTISSTMDKNKCLISITDNGIGMDEFTKQNLFKLQEGKVSEGTNQEKGSGLGLVLCKDFLDIHKSKIFVKSELNKGTTISFELELAKNNED